MGTFYSAKDNLQVVVSWLQHVSVLVAPCVYHLWVWLSPPARPLLRTLLTFILVDVVSPLVAKGGILCRGLIRITSTPKAKN
jgi:hypothetical protein